MKVEYAKEAYGIATIRWDDMVIMVKDHRGDLGRLNEMLDFFKVSIENTFGWVEGSEPVRDGTTDSSRENTRDEIPRSILRGV